MFDTKTERAIKYLTPIYNNAQMDGYREALGAVLEAARKQVRAEKDPGEVSDGYHTFNELYHHRAVLFSVICNERPELAWKSKRHHDGSMFGGMFIAGLNTPDGPATYHYTIDPYWDMFRVKELDRAPEWDGHTPAEAIMRIGTLCWEEEEPLTRNEPLSLEELRKMAERCEGVYVARDDGAPLFRERRYCAAVLDIVPEFGSSEMHIQAIYGRNLTLWEGDYKKTWVAYRVPPREVVHCKDCANRNTPDCAIRCPVWCQCVEKSLQQSWETDNDYCSWGVRRLENRGNER